MFCLDEVPVQSSCGDCFHICSDALDQGMMVTALIRCPRARLRLDYDDKPCVALVGAKVVWSHSGNFVMMFLKKRRAPHLR